VWRSREALTVRFNPSDWRKGGKPVTLVVGCSILIELVVRRELAQKLVVHGGKGNYLLGNCILILRTYTLGNCISILSTYTLYNIHCIPIVRNSKFAHHITIAFWFKKSNIQMHHNPLIFKYSFNFSFFSSFFQKYSDGVFICERLKWLLILKQVCATKYQNAELKETDILLTKWKLN
jgi:hypothetical protein